MLGNLVTKMAVRQHAEPGDLCPATPHDPTAYRHRYLLMSASPNAEPGPLIDTERIARRRFCWGPRAVRRGPQGLRSRGRSLRAEVASQSASAVTRPKVVRSFGDDRPVERGDHRRQPVEPLGPQLDAEPARSADLRLPQAETSPRLRR